MRDVLREGLERGIKRAAPGYVLIMFLLALNILRMVIL